MQIIVGGEYLSVSGYYDKEDDFFNVESVSVNRVYGNVQRITNVLCYLVESYMQKELIAEYKRVAAEQEADNKLP